MTVRTVARRPGCGVRAPRAWNAHRRVGPPHMRPRARSGAARVRRSRRLAPACTPATGPRTSSQPTVCSAIKASSIRPSRINTCSTPLKKAASVPGRRPTCKSAVRAIGGLARVDHDQPGAAVAGRPEYCMTTGKHSATFEPATRMTSDSNMSAHGLPARSMPKAFLLAAAADDHAEPAVVVDVTGPERDAGELAGEIGLLGRHAGPAEHPEGVATVAPPGSARSRRRRGRERRPTSPGAAARSRRVAHSGVRSRSGWLTC